jgi:hypothetical protein
MGGAFFAIPIIGVEMIDGYREKAAPPILQNWAKSNDTNAPKYVKILGVGKVEDIRGKIFAALV